MKWLSIVLFAAMTATCGQAKRKTHLRHHRSIHHHAAKHHFVSVDSNWITHYRELEKEFHYTVHDDEKIKAVGGRFRVPIAVRDHYEDMLRAKGDDDAQR